MHMAQWLGGLTPWHTDNSTKLQKEPLGAKAERCKMHMAARCNTMEHEQPTRSCNKKHLAQKAGKERGAHGTQAQRCSMMAHGRAI